MPWWAWVLCAGAWIPFIVFWRGHRRESEWEDACWEEKLAQQRRQEASALHLKTLELLDRDRLGLGRPRPEPTSAPGPGTKVSM